LSVIYIIPTPIGNLGDMTYRSVEILKKSYKIYAEDTRNTSKLLQHYNIDQKLFSYHQHNEHALVGKIINDLNTEEQQIALVSDAGTPGISDPGYLLISKAIEANIKVHCLPGPTALIPALVQSGFPTDEFLFIGFLPHKKGRQKKLKEIAQIQTTIVLYESPHRILKLIEEIDVYFNKERTVSISKEITKIHETNYRGTAQELINLFSSIVVKGEYVVVIEKNKTKK
tara:strand:+ start:322 stop:1005 length:684 start_codon:yes stop_codon:yes gene_type:complete